MLHPGTGAFGLFPFFVLEMTMTEEKKMGIDTPPAVETAPPRIFLSQVADAVAPVVVPAVPAAPAPK